MPDNPLASAALTYAEAGFKVLPLWWPRGAGCGCPAGAKCSSPAKHPIGMPDGAPHGCKSASSDRNKILEWWFLYPLANVGIATGGSLRVVVLDVDGEIGVESLKRLELAHGDIPITVRAWTGSGGQHIYFQGPEDPIELAQIRNKAGLDGYPGLDLRTEGGYVVAPPSRHVSGRTYRWWQKEVELVDLPRSYLSTFISGNDAPPPTTKPGGTPRNPPGQFCHSTPYGLSALEGELTVLANSPVGARNDTLNRVTFKLAALVAGNELDREDTLITLHNAALALGLTEREVAGTIRSAFTKGEDSPRSAPEMDRHLPRPVPIKGKEPAISPPSPSPALPSLIPTYTLGELMAADIPAPVEFIADRVLLKGTVNVLMGGSASGKTLHIMAMAEALATGTTFLDRAVTAPRRVLWFSAEGGRMLLRDRFNLLFNRIMPDAASLANIRIATFEELGGIPPKITDPDVKERFARLIAHHQAEVLLLDPLVLFALGIEEKSTKEWGALAAVLMWLRHETGVTVLVVHHTRKPPQNKAGYDPLDPSEARGAGVLIDLSDAVFAAYRKDDDFWFGYPKRRWGKYLPTVKLALDPDTLRFTVMGEDEPSFGKKKKPSIQEITPIIERSLVLGAWLSQADIVRMIDAHYASEREGEKTPSRNTIRGWLDQLADIGRLKTKKDGRKLMWRLV